MGSLLILPWPWLYWPSFMEHSPKRQTSSTAKYFLPHYSSRSSRQLLMGAAAVSAVPIPVGDDLAAEFGSQVPALNREIFGLVPREDDAERLGDGDYGYYGMYGDYRSYEGFDTKTSSTCLTPMIIIMTSTALDVNRCRHYQHDPSIGNDHSGQHHPYDRVCFTDQSQSR